VELRAVVAKVEPVVRHASFRARALRRTRHQRSTR
jgi:hypothetical protein